MNVRLGKDNNNEEGSEGWDMRRGKVTTDETP